MRIRRVYQSCCSGAVRAQCHPGRGDQLHLLAQHGIRAAQPELTVRRNGERVQPQLLLLRLSEEDESEGRHD